MYRAILLLACVVACTATAANKILHIHVEPIANDWCGQAGALQGNKDTNGLTCSGMGEMMGDGGADKFDLLAESSGDGDGHQHKYWATAAFKVKAVMKGSTDAAPTVMCADPAKFKECNSSVALKLSDFEEIQFKYMAPSGKEWKIPANSVEEIKFEFRAMIKEADKCTHTGEEITDASKFTIPTALAQMTGERNEANLKTQTKTESIGPKPETMVKAIDVEFNTKPKTTAEAMIGDAMMSVKGIDTTKACTTEKTYTISAHNGGAVITFKSAKTLKNIITTAAPAPGSPGAPTSNPSPSAPPSAGATTPVSFIVMAVCAIMAIRLW